RMEQTAQPGTVQISGDTHNLVAPLFEFDSPQEVEVKGKTEPVTAYQVLAEKAEPGSVRGIEGLDSPLVGRDSELQELREVLDRLQDGRGALVCLIGEAGLGKSSLLNELHTEWKKIAGDDAPWIESRGVSYDTSRPYGLFSQRMLQVIGVNDGDSIKSVREKVAVAPVGFPPDVQAKVVSALEMLLAFDDKAAGPQVQRELHDACDSLWRAAATHRPTVIVMDDLHWSDPASAQLMIDLFPLMEDVPLLLLCSFRPERQSPAWRVKQTAETEFPHIYTEVTLGALSDDDCDQLFGNLLGVSELPPQLRRIIMEKTDGNPFFLEEFIRTLIDNGSITRDESGTRWHADTNFDEISIPENLLALLTSRIDRLEEEARRTLQLSSVIGRTFYRGILEQIADTGSTLDRQLNTLQRAQLIREEARVPELEYIFQHDLTREAAYNSILLRERREFHLRVGEAVEKLFGDRLEENAPLLAHHFYQAGNNEQAVKYSIMAGKESARLYANDEAITHYTHAIELAKDGNLSTEQIIGLYMARGRAQEVSGQHDEALAGYQELEKLGREEQSGALEMAALVPMITIHSTLSGRPDIAKARNFSERSLVLAQELGDHQTEAKTLWNNLLIEILAGDDYLQAMEFGERSLQIARQYDLKEQIAFTQQDIARALVAIERFPEARVALEEAREYWRAISNQTMLADNLFNAAGVQYAQGDFAGARAFADEGLQVSCSIGSVHLEVIGLITVVQSHMNSGDVDQALFAAEDAITKLGAIVDAGFVTAFVHATTAAIYGLIGMGDTTFEHAQLAAFDHAVVAANANSPVRNWPFYISTALAHVKSGRLLEAGKALEPMYKDPAFTSKHNIEYFGILTSMPDVIRAELALAQEDFQQVLDYDTSAHGPGGDISADAVLPDLLRIKGQALIALGRIDEARATLEQAQEIGEAHGSRLALVSIYFELSEVAALEQRHEDQAQLLQQSHELIDYIANHCGRPEVRDGFLNNPPVRRALGTK
ncbi:MAG: AAA family ATPase, partial [Chloroflexi bacterium]|nr:AAA family ATPase [Chloroflexota bacterium]